MDVAVQVRGDHRRELKPELYELDGISRAHEATKAYQGYVASEEILGGSTPWIREREPGVFGLRGSSRLQFRDRRDQNHEIT